MKKVFLLLISLLCVNMMMSATVTITEEDNIKNISERVKKRYYNYTDFKVEPLYNEMDEIEYFIIEFEPTCFVLVDVAYNTTNSCYDPVFYYRYEIGFWEKYKYVEYINPKTENIEYKKEYIKEANGEYVRYHDTPYKVAGIVDERKYLITFYNKNSCLIPAVKRNGKFLNLVSMEEFDMKDINEKNVMAGLENRFAYDALLFL